MFFFAAQEYNQLLTIDVTAYHGYEDFAIDLTATAINMMPAFPISYWYVPINTHTHLKQTNICMPSNNFVSIYLAAK